MNLQLERIISELEKCRRVDFSGYRRNMLERCILDKMAGLGLDSPGEYLERLATDAGECTSLMDSILVNVSCFFRNPIVFEILAQKVLPAILERHRSRKDREIRIWSAGCAAGEEAYSVSILIQQALEKEEEHWTPHIFASDIDSEALRNAGKGLFTFDALENIKYGYLKRYFTASGNSFKLGSTIKKMVIFSEDDLTSARTMAPAESVYGNFDLILCRNVLIYFDQQLQETVMAKLWRALAPGGYLVLGEAEALDISSSSRLKTIDQRNKIFQRRA